MKFRIITAEASGGYFGYLIQKRGNHWWNVWRNSPNHVFRSFKSAKHILDTQKEFAEKVVYQDV